MSEAKPPAELWELFDAACDGRLTPTDVEHLQSLLEQPDNRRLYFDYCRMHADLHFGTRVDRAGRRAISVALNPECATFEPPDQPFIKGPEETLSKPSAGNSTLALPISESLRTGDLTDLCTGFSLGHSWRSATFFLLGSILSLAGVGIWLFAQGNSQYRALSQPSKASPVAYLTSVNNCSSGGLSRLWSVGRSIQTGDEITLEEGIAEFRLSSGVLLNVEGPAALVITSPTSLMLQYGKLTARVPWEVDDFRLLAGTCRLSASEAELGVHVFENGVEIHTFSGEVRVTPSPFVGESADGRHAEMDEAHAALEPTIVKEGKSASFVGDGRAADGPHHGEADRAKFATKLSMAGRLPAGKDYVDAVMESRPVGYWRFEAIENASVANEIEGEQPLVVVGEVSLSGDSSNRVAELGRPQTSGHFYTRDALASLSGTTSYSVELWMKPSHFHRGVLLGMTIDNDDPAIEQPEKHGFLLELQRGYESRYHPPGSVRFLHRNPPGIRLGTSCYSNRLYGLRRWQHVVAVKQKAGMLLYIDGKVVATATDKTPLAKDLRLVIGQTFKSDSVFPFVGQFDELAIYNRALIDSEIQKHQEAAQPKSRDRDDF